MLVKPSLPSFYPVYLVRLERHSSTSCYLVFTEFLPSFYLVFMGRPSFYRVIDFRRLHFDHTFVYLVYRVLPSFHGFQRLLNCVYRIFT